MEIKSCSVWELGPVISVCRRSSARGDRIYSEISVMEASRLEGQRCRLLLGELTPRGLGRG